MLRDVRALVSLSLVALALAAGGARAEPVASATSFPVAKDASLIEKSLCCGVAADKNFGTAATVDAGRYHHSARALFGYATEAVDAARIAKVELVLPPAQLVGDARSEVRVLVVAGDALWDEGTVTWNDAPAATELGVFPIEASTATHIDVTALFGEGVPAGEVSFIVEATRSNVFFPSREAAPDSGNALVVTLTPPGCDG